MSVRALVPAFALILTATPARAEVCVRPADPQGFAGYRYADAAIARFDTPAIRVWYATSGKHAVTTASSRADDVPDDVSKVGEVTEAARRLRLRDGSFLGRRNGAVGRGNTLA
jgi:hypothetical protein